MSKNIHIKIPYRHLTKSAFGEIFYPIIDLEVLGVGRKVKTVPFLLDTGADTSLVSYDLIKSLLGNSVRQDSAKILVTGVGGMKDYYTTQLACRLSGVEFSLKVLFPSEKEFPPIPNLLGRNFLKFFNILLKEKECEVAAWIKKVVPKKATFHKFSRPTKEQIRYYDMRRNTTLIFGGDVTKSNIDVSSGKIKSPQTLRIESPDTILKEISKNVNLLGKSPVGEWSRSIAKVNEIYMGVRDDVLQKRIREVLRDEFEKKIKEDKSFVNKAVSWLKTTLVNVGTNFAGSLLATIIATLK